MAIFRRIRGPVGGVIFGGRNPIILFLLRDKEVGKVKANIGLIKIVISLNKVREKIKTLREVIFFFIRNL